MKHPEQKSNRQLVEVLILRAFIKGLVVGSLAGAGLAGLGIAAAVTFWMLAP